MIQRRFVVQNGVCTFLSFFSFARKVIDRNNKGFTRGSRKTWNGKMHRENFKRNNEVILGEYTEAAKAFLSSCPIIGKGEP